MGISLTDLYYSDDYVVYDLEWLKSPWCRTCSFLATVSYVSSALFLVFTTLDQVFLARRGQNNNASSFYLVATSNAVWGFCLVLSLVPLVISEWEMPSSNSLCLGLPFFVEHPTGYVFSSLVYVLLLFLCSLVCIYMTLKITIEKTIVTKDCKTGQRKVVVLITLLSALYWLVVCIMYLISALVDGGNLYVMGFKSIFVIPLKSATVPYIFVGPFAYSKWIDFKNGRQGQHN